MSFTHRFRHAALPVIAVSALFSLTAIAHAAIPLDSVREMASEGRGAEALRTLDGLLGAQPDDRGGLFLKGVLLVELRRTEEAEEVFTSLIDRYPEMPEPYNNLAVLQAASGRYDEAVDTLQKALETHPSYETAYSNLTKIYGQLASEAYNRALTGEATSQTDVVELVLLGNLVESAALEMSSGPPPPVVPPTGPAPVMDEPAAELPPQEPLPSETPVAAVESEPVAEDAADDAALISTVTGWAEAWSGQRVDDYLSYYSERFVPPGGLGRAAWERQRGQRLSAPEFIQVSIAILDSASRGPGRSSIRFIQSYESNTFKDTVTKTLEMIREGESWKILEEKVEQ